MITRPITVVIPVGPKPHHREWLEESLESLFTQTELPSELLVVDDGGQLDDSRLPRQFPIPIRVHHSIWNLGVVASLNIGVASSFNNLVLLGCADDRFLPSCVERCWESWQRERESLGYYYLGVRYSDGREQNTACGAAMVTKDLWRYTGGFPPQASVGAADHIFLSMLIGGARDGHSRAKIIRVSDEVLYWYRVHDKIETSNNIWPAIEAVRDRLTAEWRPREAL